MEPRNFTFPLQWSDLSTGVVISDHLSEQIESLEWIDNISRGDSKIVQSFYMYSGTIGRIKKVEIALGYLHFLSFI